MFDGNVQILSISDARHVHSAFRPMHREYAAASNSIATPKATDDPYALGLADGQDLRSQPCFRAPDANTREGTQERPKERD